MSTVTYDIARLFDTGLGWFWSAGHSQIYPELRRLDDKTPREQALTLLLREPAYGGDVELEIAWAQRGPCARSPSTSVTTLSRPEPGPMSRCATRGRSVDRD